MSWTPPAPPVRCPTSGWNSRHCPTVLAAVDEASGTDGDRHGPTVMSAWWRGTQLVAGRALGQNLRSRSFKVVTAVLLLLSIAVVVCRDC